MKIEIEDFVLEDLLKKSHNYNNAKKLLEKKSLKIEKQKNEIKYLKNVNKRLEIKYDEIVNKIKSMF